MEITLNDFTNITDLEKSKYLLLNKLQSCEREFDESRIYPTLSMLVGIHSSLLEILSGRDKIFNKEYGENTEQDNDTVMNIELERSFEFMDWGHQKIRLLIETGKEIFDFVEDNISIESIGLSSEQIYEGYFILPDNKNFIGHIIKYNRILHNCLKTKEALSFKMRLVTIPNEVIKNRIISEDILNQIIFYLDTDLSFHYSQTILPVAKRKFLSYLESRLIN
jgi:hypothetical protein